MLWLAIAALIPQAPPAEVEALVLETISELRAELPEPTAARFRRVHIRSTIGQDGRRHRSLCGQVDMDDPRGPEGWTVFASAQIRGRLVLIIGNTGTFQNAAVFCRRSASDEWSDEDLSARFDEAL